MRLFAPVLLLSLSYFAVHNYQAQHARREADIEQPQPAYAVMRFTIEQPNAAYEHDDPYDARRDCLYRIYLASTILGVFAALGGIFAIYQQTQATTEAAQATRDSAEATKDSAEATLRSAKASEKSVKLQEIAQKQWVNLDEWKAQRFGNNDLLEVNFRIVNPTNVLLTLHAVMTTISGGQRDDFGQVTLVAPGNPFMHSVGVKLSAEQIALFDKGALAFVIECKVLFADAHGTHWQQDFGRLLLCGPDGTVATDTKNTLRESGVPGEPGASHT